MIEQVYTSGEYMEELDNLENAVDTLLQIIMDDGTTKKKVYKKRERNKLNVPYKF